MELHNEITIEAPAERVWRALGERFMHVGEWAAPITSSCAIGPEELAAGAVRACSIPPFGPFRAGVVKERLTTFDRAQMALAYEAIEGMPRSVARAVNRWSVEPLDDGRSVVRIHATLTLRGFARLLSCPMKWRLEAEGARVAEELKHFVERGHPHPRKRAAPGPSTAPRHALPDQGSAGLPPRG